MFVSPEMSLYCADKMEPTFLFQIQPSHFESCYCADWSK